MISWVAMSVRRKKPRLMTGGAILGRATSDRRRRRRRRDRRAQCAHGPR
jgi:hypothetical protein